MHRFISIFMMIAIWIFIASVVDAQSDKCKKDNSGAFLVRYTDVTDQTTTGYRLALFSPTNGVVEVYSTAGNNPDNYTSDFVGYYQCRETSRPERAILTSRGILFQGPEDPSVYVSNTRMNCTDADGDCSDTIIQCSSGRTTTQAYELDLPNRQTARFTRPIPGSASNRPISSKRIFSHPSTKGPGQSKCYNSSSGIFIIQYSDNTYDIVLNSGTGFSLAIYSGDADSSNNYGSSTAIGEWFCSGGRSITGFSTHFTYATNPADQSIVQSSFYGSCPTTGLQNCTGTLTDVYFPLQDSFLPFNDGQSGLEDVFTFQMSRFYELRNPKPCHEKYSGVYIFNYTILNPNATYFNSYLFYSDGTLFSTGVHETNPSRGYSNALGIWNCDDLGNIQTDQVFFRFSNDNSNPNKAFGRIVQNYNCNEKADRCIGRYNEYRTPGLAMPGDGNLQSWEYLTGFTIKGRRLDKKI